MPDIVILEDDYLQAEQISEALRAKFKGADILIVKTEQEFHDIVKKDFTAPPPQIFILDIMVRWTNPSRQVSKLIDNQAGDGFFRAGFRCENLLRQTDSKVPVILYSVLAEDDVGAELRSVGKNTHYVAKDSYLADLVDLVSQLWKLQSRRS